MRFNGGDFREVTIGQLLKSGCKIAIYEYEQQGQEPNVIIIGGDATMVDPTPVARGKPREKRKYESQYDEEREMQIQMGTLYYLRRRGYDPDGTKGIKVSYRTAAQVIINFFANILPVSVKMPCCSKPGYTDIKEEPIGYLRSRCGDSATQSLTKAIERRAKKGREFVF